jgi:hypothetical protein
VGTFLYRLFCLLIFKLKEYFLNNSGTSLVGDVLISHDHHNIVIKKLPVPTERATVSLSKVRKIKQCIVTFATGTY